MTHVSTSGLQSGSIDRELRSSIDRPPQHAGQTRTALQIYQHDVQDIKGELGRRGVQQTTLAAGENERHYARLYDLAPAAYLTLDADGRVKEAHLRASTVLSIPRARLLGAPLASFFRAADMRRFFRHLRRCFELNAETVTELTFLVGGPGASRTMQMISRPSSDKPKKPARCYTVLIDISEAKQEEERRSLVAEASRILSGSVLREGAAPAAWTVHEGVLSEVVRLTVERCADLAWLEFVDNGVLRRIGCGWEFGRYGRPERCDLTFPGILQRTVIASGQSICLPNCFADGVVETLGPELWSVVRRAGTGALMLVPLRSGASTLGVLTLVAARRRRTFSAEDLKTAEDLAGRIVTSVESFRVHREAREAVKSREQHLACVAHDLQNPVSAIRLLTMAAVSRPLSVERRRGWYRLDRVRQIAEHMNRMIRDLAEFSAHDDRLVRVQFEARDVASMLTDMVQALLPLADERGIKLRLKTPMASGSVVCDVDRVQQILSNLVGNALKFTRPGGTIEIASTDMNDRVRFMVVDSGSGIAASHLPHVFEKYWRGQQGARGGRGLGLHIAKLLVEAQGGDIWCESELDKGTVVTFTLLRPLAAQLGPRADQNAVTLSLDGHAAQSD